MIRIAQKTLWGITLIFLVIFASCREDFEFNPATGTLEFSKDTVFLDTIFTNIGSSTYTLKVYNRSNEDIFIPQVVLRNGNESKYRLNVDGVSGKEFMNTPLLANDSLFVFVETTFDISDTGENEFLYTDGIQFGDTGNYQEVELVTLVRDAVFLYPRTLGDGTDETLLLGLDEEGNEIRIEGFLLEDDELHFTNEKPYVIYGYAAVGQEKTLRMDAGTRIYFHNNSGILVGSGGTLLVEGTLSMDQVLLENEVIFEGDRLEPEFEVVPGQWGTIWLASGSIGNTIQHLTIKNATIGLFVEGDGLLDAPTLEIGNSQIHNSSQANLWATTAKINAQNCVFGNTGNVSLYCNLGGDYSFEHCTIANYWTSGFRNTPALLLNNYVELDDGQFLSGNLSNATFANCIVDGNRNLEFLLFSNETNDFNYNFVNCSLKFEDDNQEFLENPLYDFSDQARFENSFLNLNTAFFDVQNNNFQLTLDSEVIDLGNSITAMQVPIDILGMDRTPNPDLGAFEFYPQN